jgi:putative membrane protein
VSGDLDYLDEPRHLHPASIFMGWLRRLPSFAVAIPALIFAKQGWIVLAGLGAVFLVSALLAWLRWRHFTYRIDGDALVIEQGLLSRSRRAIPLERIQDVSIEQGVLARILGVVKVKIETGGGTADEGSLESVSAAEAHRLRETLRAGVRMASPAVAGTDAGTEEPLFAMSFGRVLLFGAFSFSLLWMAALGGALQFVDDILPIRRRDVIAWLDIAGHEASARFGITLVLAAIGALLVLGFLSGLVGTVLREFGFRLMHGEGRFRRVRGLLTRSEVAIAIRRIQLVLIERRLVRGALGFAALEFQALGGSNDKGGRQAMAPFATAAEIGAVIDAAGMPRFERPGMKPVALGHVARALVEKAVPFAAALTATALILTPWAWWGLVSVPAIIGVSLLLRRYHRYATRETSVQVMRGVLRRREWVVPYAAVQVVSVRQGLLQRMLGIASVQIDTAGASGQARPHVEDAMTGDAIALTRELIARA